MLQVAERLMTHRFFSLVRDRAVDPQGFNMGYGSG